MLALPQSFKQICQTYGSHSRRTTTTEAKPAVFKGCLVNIKSYVYFCTPYSALLFLENTTRNPWEPLKWNLVKFYIEVRRHVRTGPTFLRQHCYKWTLAQPAIMKIMFSLFWGLENLCMYVCACMYESIYWMCLTFARHRGWDSKVKPGWGQKTLEDTDFCLRCFYLRHLFSDQ